MMFDQLRGRRREERGLPRRKAPGNFWSAGPTGKQPAVRPAHRSNRPWDPGITAHGGQCTRASAKAQKTGPTACHTGPTALQNKSHWRSDRHSRRSDRHLAGKSREDLFWSLVEFPPRPSGGPTAHPTGRTDTYLESPERTFLWSLVGFWGRSLLAVRPPRPTGPTASSGPTATSTPVGPARRLDQAQLAQPEPNYKRASTPLEKGRKNLEHELCSCLGLASKHPRLGVMLMF